MNNSIHLHNQHKKHRCFEKGEMDISITNTTESSAPFQQDGAVSMTLSFVFHSSVLTIFKSFLQFVKNYLTADRNIADKIFLYILFTFLLSSQHIIFCSHIFNARWFIKIVISLNNMMTKTVFNISEKKLIQSVQATINYRNHSIYGKTKFFNICDLRNVLPI